MIIREVKRADTPVLLALCKKVWGQLKLPVDLPKARVWLGNAVAGSSLRVVVIHDPDLVATLAALRCDTADGPTFRIYLFAVDQDRPDRLRLADALSLYSLNLGISEGCKVVISTHDKQAKAASYGQVYLGQVVKAQSATDAILWGLAKPMMERILERNPKWQTSLSSMTPT